MVSPLELEQYDVVVCGGGTAGCVVANRLTEDPNITVLMLEAGGDARQDPRVSTPGLFTALFDDPSIDWSFPTEPSAGLDGRSVGHPRGKCIGGSSAINLMGLVYPSKASLNAWVDLGNPGWSWKDMAQYYEKSVQRCPPSEEEQKVLSIDLRGEREDAPIKGSYGVVNGPVQTAWMNAHREIGGGIWNGYPRSDGPAEGAYLGCWSVDPDKAERSYAATGYYTPAAERKNLHVVTNALIDKVQVESTPFGTAKARAVEFLHNGQRYTAHAAKEIVICAGVFGSPAILQRSGIAERKLCEELSIRNIHDNPFIGRNLQDHLMIGMSYEVKDEIFTTDKYRDFSLVQQAMEEYQTSRSGRLAQLGDWAWANASLHASSDPLPEKAMKEVLDQHLVGKNEPSFPAKTKQYSIIRSIIEDPDEATVSTVIGSCQANGTGATAKEVFMPARPENYLSVFPALAHPLSRGSVHITSADCNVYPKISFNYLDHPLDSEVLARHAMQVEKIVATESFKEVLKPGGKRIPEGKDAFTLEHAKELIKSSQSNYHPCGTCAMMPEDMGGVVDNRLKVYGVEGLRVCDASVFPMQVRGNIMTTVYAVGEKCSDMIKEDLGKK